MRPGLGRRRVHLRRRLVHLRQGDRCWQVRSARWRWSLRWWRGRRRGAGGTIGLAPQAGPQPGSEPARGTGRELREEWDAVLCASHGLGTGCGIWRVTRASARLGPGAVLGERASLREGVDFGERASLGERPSLGERVDLRDPANQREQASLRCRPGWRDGRRVRVAQAVEARIGIVRDLERPGIWRSSGMWRDHPRWTLFRFGPRLGGGDRRRGIALRYLGPW